ncbi:uncharacterized protein [Trachinotus anak]|uniref:uncharacterized protein n=1 Tax=Trachinotus anak TaxID=443729 RepID=UPI0039F17E49
MYILSGLLSVRWPVGTSMSLWNITGTETRDVQSEGDRQVTDTQTGREESDMLVLVMSLLCWSQAEGGCRGPLVIISANKMMLSDGEDLRLRCDFTCLRAKHVAQLWKNREYEDRVSLVNVTSLVPSVSLVVNMSFATEAHTGYYSCMTQPPDTISPDIFIQTAYNLTTVTSTPTTSSTSRCDSTQQLKGAAGLQGQIWFWMLLGKCALLLLSLASLAVKHKRG